MLGKAIKDLKKSCTQLCVKLWANQISLPQQQHKLTESSARVAGTHFHSDSTMIYYCQPHDVLQKHVFPLHLKCKFSFSAVLICNFTGEGFDRMTGAVFFPPLRLSDLHSQLLDRLGNTVTSKTNLLCLRLQAALLFTTPPGWNGERVLLTVTGTSLLTDQFGNTWKNEF